MKNKVSACSASAWCFKKNIFNAVLDDSAGVSPQIQRVGCVCDSKLNLCTMMLAPTSYPASLHPKATQTTLFTQMLAVYRAGEYTMHQPPSATPPQGQELLWTQPIKDQQTLRLHGQQETFHPAHSKTALVSGFRCARQQGPGRVPGRTGSQHFWFNINRWVKSR